jgi:hypothetical protein
MHWFCCAIVAVLFFAGTLAPQTVRAEENGVRTDACIVAVLTTPKWSGRRLSIRVSNAGETTADEVTVTVPHVGTFVDHGSFAKGASTTFDVHSRTLDGSPPRRLKCAVTTVHYVDGRIWTATI